MHLLALRILFAMQQVFSERSLTATQTRHLTMRLACQLNAQAQHSILHERFTDKKPSRSWVFYVVLDLVAVYRELRANRFNFLTHGINHRLITHVVENIANPTGQLTTLCFFKAARGTAGVPIRRPEVTKVSVDRLVRSFCSQ